VVSDDGRRALSLIAMLGSVFSPFYFAARARGAADPLDFSAMNVALYTERGDRWVLTERSRRAVARSEGELALGPSRMRWEGSSLVIDLEERTAPLPRRLAGRIVLHPEVTAGDTVHLDAAGRHRWVPISPLARAEVTLTHPAIRFSGAAYLDSNGGDEPLEDAFSGWTWARVAGRGGAAITYDVDRRDGSRLLVTRGFGRGGREERGFAVETVDVAPTMWRMRRAIHADPGARPRALRTLEDTPFYARTLVETRLRGEHAEGTHETLSLDRFRTRPVQFMLPYRMRREQA
jgi:carotenoid 1,2-hydratase